MRIAGLAALAVAIALFLDLVTSKAVGYDLAAYILGARRLLAGEELYPSGPVALGPFGQFFYPPPVAVLFAPLATIPFDAARLLFLVALTALAAYVGWRLVRDLRPEVRYWAAAGYVLFFPLIWEIGLGNLTLVSLALCLAAWSARGYPARAGSALAGAIGLKLLGLPLVPFFVIGAGSVGAWAAVWLAVVALVTAPFVGAEWPRYAALLGEISASAPGSGSNIVPALFAAPALRPVLPGLALLISAVTGLAARRSPAVADHAFRVALAAAPLFAPTLWYPYLIFALPLLLASGPRPAPSPRRAFAAARPLCWVLIEAQLIRDPGRDALLPLVGLLALVALGCLELAFALRASDAPGAQRPDRPRPLATRPAAAP